METGKRTVKWRAVEDQWMRREEEIDRLTDSQIDIWIVCFRTRAERDK